MKKINPILATGLLLFCCVNASAKHSFEDGLEQAQANYERALEARDRSRVMLGGPVSVGPGCQYAQPQAALDDGNPVLHLVKNTEYDAVFWDDDMTLVGGFDDCQSASDGISTPTGISELSGNLSNNALNITSANQVTVNIENIIFREGADGPLAPAGAVTVLLPNGGDVTMQRVAFSGNGGINGGGIAVFGGGSNTQLNLFEVVANHQSNVAENGGLLFCNNATVVASAFVLNGSINVPGGKGGAVHATNNCSATFVANDSDWSYLSNFNNNIIRGESPESGAAVYAEGGSTVHLLGQFLNDSHHFIVGGDLVSGGTHFMRGGGIHATGTGTQVTVAGVGLNDSSIFWHNGVGAAMAVDDNASLVMSRTNGECVGYYSSTGYPNPCNEIRFNSGQSQPFADDATATGSAVYVDSGGHVEISQTSFYQNPTSGYLIHATGQDSHLILEGNSINGNLDSSVKGMVGLFDSATANLAHNSFSINPSSVVNNFIATLVSEDAEMTVHNSIFYSTNGLFFYPNFDALGTDSGNDTFVCNVLDELGSISATSQAENVLMHMHPTNQPMYPFNIANNQVLHTKLSSKAVDLCDTSHIMPLHNDIDDESRGALCLTPGGCTSGFTYDAGADEIGDLIYASAFD